MAGDWIKMRYSLVSDPKVISIGNYLWRHVDGFSMDITLGQYSDVTLSNVTLRYIVTGALHAVWCAVNEHSKESCVHGADLSWIDEVCGIDGFGKAMESVGWVDQTNAGIVFPKFDSNNTSGAERVRRFREKMKRYGNGYSNVTCNVTSNGDVTVREEKRREEKNSNTPPNPPKGGEPLAKYSRQSKRPPKPDPIEELERQHLARKAAEKGGGK